MRHALSLLLGIAVALVCVLLLHQASSLSLLALAGCGLGVCLLTRTWSYNLPVVRRGSVRLRIFWRRHGRDAWPLPVETMPFLRRQMGRVNPMWLSYVLIAGWAFVEILDATPRFSAAPIEHAAGGASTAMEAVAGTSAAIRAMSAVGESAHRDLASGIIAAALPKKGAAADRAMSQSDGRDPVMGAPAEPRTGQSGCETSSMLQSLLLPQPPVKEF